MSGAHLVAVYLQAGFFSQSQVFMIRETLVITPNLENNNNNKPFL